MSAHTPGPWKRGTCAASGKNLAICADWRVLAIVHGTGYPPGRGGSAENDATANLIAAAPDMHAYIVKRAMVGDTEAQAILDAISEGATP